MKRSQEKKTVRRQYSKNIRNLLKLRNENEASKKRIIRDYKDYYKPVREGSFSSNNYVVYKIIVMEIKPYQSKKTSIKLTLFRMGLFGAAHKWERTNKTPLLIPKFYHTYPIMMITKLHLI